MYYPIFYIFHRLPDWHYSDNKEQLESIFCRNISTPALYNQRIRELRDALLQTFNGEPLAKLLDPFIVDDSGKLTVSFTYFWKKLFLI